MGVSLEEMLGQVSKELNTEQTGLPASAVDLETMVGAPTAENEADEGFFLRSGRALYNWYLGSHQHPVDNLTGMAKGITAGAVTLGRLAATGIAGLARTAVQLSDAPAQEMRKPGSSKLTWAENMEKSSFNAERFLEEDKKFSEGILYINLAPKNQQEEAVAKFLGIIPDAIIATGDTVYEKTGSALAGAGSQALLTALSMKPSVASKMFKGVKNLKTGEGTPGGRAGAAKVVKTFEELVVKDEQAAQTLKEHIEKADPELGAMLDEAIKEAKAKDPEKLGEEVAKLSIEKRSTRDFEGIAVKSPNGETTAIPTEKTLIIADTETTPTARGKGEGTARVIKLVEEAERTGKRLVSSDKVSKDQQQVYEALKKRGYQVTENPSKVDPKTGEKYTIDAGPVYEVSSAKASKVTKPVSAADLTSKISEVTFEAQDIFQKPDIKVTSTPETIRKANEAYAKQLKEQERLEVESKLKHTESDGRHSVDSENGSTEAVDLGDRLKVEYTATAAKAKGFGEGTARMEKLARIAADNDKYLSSDVTVSKEQIRVYDSLKRRGWLVKKNPSTVNPETGSLISNDPRVPVFEVRRKPSGWSRSAMKTPDPVVFVDAGHPVTRTSVETAFRLGDQALDKVPGVGIVKGKLTEYYDQLIRTINPEALGPEAKTSASILAKHIATQMQRDSQFFHRAAERRAYWAHNPTGTIEFIKRFERGEKFSDPILNKAAEGYRSWNEQIYKADQKLGLKYEPVDNYLAHLFENSEAATAYFERKYGKRWGDPAFIKDRSFDLYEEAIAAGHKPKFSNPEDIMLARQHASDIASMRVNTLKELKKAGLATEAKPGGGRPQDFPAQEWRSPTGQRYWVHDSASGILENAWNTQSLWNMPGIAGDTFRGAMALKNTIVPIKLALSLFHPLHVLTIDNATGMVRASKELLSGTMTPGKWMKEMGQAAMYKGFIDSPKGGYRLLKAYQGKLADADMTPADVQALTYMAEGGFIPEMSAQYKTSAVQNFKDAIARRSATSLFHAPLAAISLTQKPMFEIWIPSLKIASYLKDVQTAIKVDPSLLDNPIKRQVAFRRIAKSVDNRYGEMAYNTLFWNRWVKDLAVANTLSLGWQMGFIREYGGGMMDLGQVVTKQGSVVQKVKSGMLDRPLFVTFYTTQALAYGGLLTWALSGEEPKDFNDYIYPRSGEVTPEGKPERLNTMFYPREFSAIYKHMENEGIVSGLGHLAANKASGVVGMTREWATGVNSFGQEIRDPDAPAYKKLEQTLVYTLTDLEPISIGAIRDQVSENPLKSGVLNIAGFSPAPRYVTESKTEGLIRGTFQKYFSQKQTPFERAEYSQDAKKLRQAYEKGDGDTYSEILGKMQEKYGLTGVEQRRLEVRLARGSEPLFSMFERLTWKQQKKILDQMTEEEREVYLPHANRQHLRYSYEAPEAK